MSNILPDGDDLRRAVKWVSESIQESPGKPAQKFVQDAIFRFNISPRDAEFLIGFFGNTRDNSELF